MSQTYNLGKVAITPRGAYSSTAQYTPLDILSYNGSSYLVSQNCMGVTPPNATYYMVVASKGDTGSSGASPTIAAGTVTMTPAGTSASVTNVGTNVNASFNFTLPNGNVIYTGTGVTGTSTTPTVFSGSGVSNAGVGDIYINTSTVAFYRCALGGAASTAKWAFLTYAVPSGSVTTAKIADSAVTRNKIADGAIGTDEIADGSVSSSKLGSDVTATLENKANVDGAYEQMTVGNAEQLVSTVGVEDNAPYTFRTTGGSADVGDRMNLKAVIGGTVAWNQLVDKTNFQANGYSLRGLTVTNDGSGIVKVSGTFDATGYIDIYTQTYFNTVKDHKYYISVPKLPTGVTGYNVIVGGGGLSYKSNNGAFVVNGASTGTAYVLFRIPDKITGVPANTVFTNYAVYVNVFDLTAMFGSTIADYIYALEQSNSGSGVAYFRKLFPKPYYAYNSGELLSVQTSAHRVVWFNQWDEEWELGSLSSSGEPIAQTNTIRSTNYCKCFPNTAYYVRSPKTDGGSQNRYYIKIVWYGADKSFISGSWENNRVVTSPNNASYFKIHTNTSTVVYGSTYLNDICINLHWDGERDGEYEPYEAHTYALDDVELRGVLKLDASNNLYYDGDEYTPDGTVTRKYGIVDLGTLDWQKTSGKNNLFNTRLSLSTAAYGGSNNAVCKAVCAKYVAASSTSTYSNETDKTVSFTSTGYCYIEDTAYTDAATFKAAMSGVYLVYELATPTTESADPYTELQICDDFGTEEFVDAATRDFEMPVGHNTVYQPNLRAKLEMSPNSPDSAGDFIVRQTNGTNEYVPVSDNSIISGLTTRCPACPTDTDGTFVLKATVSGGAVTYSWVSE